MIPNEVDLLNTLRARQERPETRARFATGRLNGWPGADADDVPVVNSDRSRYIASLETKRASGFKTQGEQIRQAEHEMERNRQEAKEQLLHGGLRAAHPAGTAQSRALRALTESAEAAGRARRDDVEGHMWRAQAAQRERSRQRMVATNGWRRDWRTPSCA